jgi:phosphate transport system substrate-binding protein
MKKIALTLVLLLTLTLSACVVGGDGDNDSFDETSSIKVYTRDTSSGTRDGFMSGIGFSAATKDDSILVPGFITAGNAEQVSAVQTDPYAIGYVSLSTLNSQLFKGLNFDTVAPTEANVLNGSYKLSRNFNYMLRDDYSVYGADAQAYEQLSKAFIAYMGSTEGLSSIAQAGGIVDLTSGQPWDTVKAAFPICGQDNKAYTLKIGGSDSVEKIATDISPDFSAKCGNVVPQHNHTGSSNAYKGLNGSNAAINDALSIHVGFASREFTAQEPALIKGKVATDAIVAIVHLDNPVNNVSAFDLKSIYAGDVRTWETFVERTNFAGTIKAYTRDTSSGTRDGFMSGIGFSAATKDDSILVPGFITAGNAEQVSAVQTDRFAIGYVSLSTLNTQLFKGLYFDGVAPTEANVLNGSYKLSRNFNYMLRDDYSVYGADAQAYEQLSKAFIAYMGSTEGLSSIAQAGGIVDLTSGQPWDTVKAAFPICGQDNKAYTLKIGGSDSVEKIATDISPDFSAKCGNVVPQHNHTGSSNAYKGLNGSNAAINDALSIHVGFASREFTAQEPALVKGKVATDAIVAIVHLDNPLTSITASALKRVYGGEVTNWSAFF